MLLINGSRLTSNPGRFSPASIAFAEQWIGIGARRGFWFGDGTQEAGASIADTAAIPNGYEPPYCWVMPIKPGGLSAYNTISGDGDITLAALAMGQAIEAALAGSGTISAADVGVIVQFAAALSGIGTISAASTQLAVSLAAAITSGGNVSAASLALIVSIEADLLASGGASGVMVGFASMAGDISVTGDLLSTANVAAAVWGALAAFNDQAGTMGEQLNNAGASGNPWDSPLEGTYTAGDILRIVSAVLAGKVSGAPTGPVVFRDINDTKDRVAAAVTVDGNRTAVTLDET